MSVLIPTYDRPALLREAVDSVLHQGESDVEVIVRDDAGEHPADDTLRDHRDPRLRVVRNERNLGLGATNQLLYSEARGKYVAHLDDDDTWDPQFLRALLDPLESDADLDLAFANHVVVDEEGLPQRRLTELGRQRWGRSSLSAGLTEEGRFVAAVLRAVPMSHSAIVRTSAVDATTLAPAARAWDMWLACQAVRRTGRMWFDDRELSRYRVHRAQMSGILVPEIASDSTFQGLAWCLEQLVEDNAFTSERPHLERQLAHVRASWAVSRLREGDRSGARALVGHSFAASATLLGGAVAATVAAAHVLPSRATRAGLDGAVALRARRW